MAKITSEALVSLRTQLRHPLRVSLVGRRDIGPGIAAQEQIVTTNRLILVLRGGLNYRIEDRRCRLNAGTQFFVPAWVRRVSSVPSGGHCEFIWCEFDLEGGEPPGRAMHCRKTAAGAASLEKSSYLRLLALWKRAGLQADESLGLQLEGELKAMLARFWAEAVPPPERKGTGRPGKAERPIHPKVKEALRWISDHYCDRDALEALYREVAVSPNYLRLHFQKAMSCSPGAYIQRLRLRQARYLLHETTLAHKEIAFQLGYEDPLYFSRLYHRFWGKAARADRRRS